MSKWLRGLGYPSFFVLATLCTAVFALTGLSSLPARSQEMRWEPGIILPVVLAFVFPVCGVLLNIGRWEELPKTQRIAVIVLIAIIPLLWLILGHPYRHPREV
jgi:hypothetical protein